MPLWSRWPPQGSKGHLSRWFCSISRIQMCRPWQSHSSCLMDRQLGLSSPALPLLQDHQSLRCPAKKSPCSGKKVQHSLNIQSTFTRHQLFQDMRAGISTNADLICQEPGRLDQSICSSNSKVQPDKSRIVKQFLSVIWLLYVFWPFRFAHVSSVVQKLSFAWHRTIASILDVVDAYCKSANGHPATEWECQDVVDQLDLAMFNVWKHEENTPSSNDQKPCELKWHWFITHASRDPSSASFARTWPSINAQLASRPVVGSWAAWKVKSAKPANHENHAKWNEMVLKCSYKLVIIPTPSIPAAIMTGLWERSTEWYYQESQPLRVEWNSLENCSIKECGQGASRNMIGGDTTSSTPGPRENLEFWKLAIWSRFMSFQLLFWCFWNVERSIKFFQAYCHSSALSTRHTSS